MRPRFLGGLLVLVVGLLAFIWFYEKDLPSSAERAELEKKILKVSQDEISSIRIERGEEIVVLAKQSEIGAAEDHWSVIAPFEARADRERVDELLETMQKLESKRTLESVSAGEGGFDPPRARVSVAHDGQTSELLVGNEIPASASMLVRLFGSNETSVVDSGIWEQLARPPGEWRDRDMFFATADQVTKVILGRTSDELVMSRRDDNHFWIEVPVQDLAGRDQVGDLLADVTSLRADAFVEDPNLSPAELGLEPPDRFVDVEVDSLNSIRIEFGSSVPDVESRFFARIENQIFETSSNLVSVLDRPVDDWRSLDLTSLETYQVDRLEIEDSVNGSLELTRVGADWKRNDDEISFTTVSNLLYAIVDSRASQALDIDSEGGFPSAPPRLRVSLYGDSAEGGFSVFETASDDEVRVTVNGRDVVMVLDRQTFLNIEEKLAEVRAAEGRSEDNFSNLVNPQADQSSSDD
jgi:hypothetical protein